MRTTSTVASRIEGLSVVWRVRLLLASGIIATNIAGAVLVYCLAALVVPLPSVPDDARVRLVNLVITAVYGGLAVLYGVLRGLHQLRPVVRWVRSGEAPDDDVRRRVIATPMLLTLLQGRLWAVAAVGFGAFNASIEPRLGATVALIVALAGWSACSVTYLVSELALRPFARRALATGVPRPAMRSVVRRAMATWAFGTGVILLGSVLIGLAVLIEPQDATRSRLAVTMIVLGALGLVVGGLSSYLAAKASADPVRGLRKALAQVEQGRYDVQIPIYDGTEIGLLQAGFNSMAAGLREREQIRDLFGRHVGEDVARAALEGGVRLGGEVREVAVLFVDLVGSTRLAENRPPDEVVGLLNRFFQVVVHVVHEYDGWINKFAGDAALAVWGAPMEVPDQATAVLAAARTMAARLRVEVPELEAGIGVSAGRAVAGNVGADLRYEYTVIGDPVNEAARLTELAKSVPSHVLAHGALLDAASAAEAARWQRLDPVVVRGRSEPTPLATPLT